MPSLFKERLFVWLSRFCPMRYCIVRHVGFLLGRGHGRAAGDEDAASQSIDEIIATLESIPHVMECWPAAVKPLTEEALRQLMH
jgi:hypothetical protein